MSSFEKVCSVCGELLEGGICADCTVPGLESQSVEDGIEVGVKKAAGSSASASLMELTSRKIYAVSEPRCRIGRDSANDIALMGDKSVSRYHCVISSSGGKYFIEDLKSKNGSFVNAERVDSKCKIKDGDSIRLGTVRFKMMTHESPEAQTLEFSKSLEGGQDE